MFSFKYLNVLLILILLRAIKFGLTAVVGGGITTPEWTNYKEYFGKTYPTPQAETYAQYYYNYNKRLINNHNALARRGLRSFTLGENQFTDLRFVQFNQLFPKSTLPAQSNAAPLPVVQAAPPSYDPITDLGIAISVENQGTVCSSGWAYATAKAIEAMQAQQMGNVSPARLSAQNLIDCAGGSTACTTQVPHLAFDYLAEHGQGLHLESDYNNHNTWTQSGMCIPPAVAVTTNLASYSGLQDADDAAMLKYVGAGYPVVIEFDPTSFEFMHYAGGIFQPPRTVGGSHHLVVLGYGNDGATGLDYWLVQNSFNTTWGEEGLMRIIRNVSNPLARSALLPIDLGP